MQILFVFTDPLDFVSNFALTNVLSSLIYFASPKANITKILLWMGKYWKGINIVFHLAFSVI